MYASANASNQPDAREWAGRQFCRRRPRHAAARFSPRRLRENAHRMRERRRRIQERMAAGSG